MLRKDTDELITFLDSLAKLDPVAMGKLVGHRVLCNGALGTHPTVQVGSRDDDRASCEVGMLGIFNGYCGTIEEGKYNGWGAIAAIVEEDSRVTGFCHICSSEAEEASRPRSCRTEDN
jgi:hypothetical protein